MFTFVLLQLDDAGAKMSEVIITIDTPVYNITDQTGFIELVREAVLTVTSDNAFMTLIDYDNIALVLPERENEFKANPQLCCHTCPEGHAYRLGNCGKSPRFIDFLCVNSLSLYIEFL